MPLEPSANTFRYCGFLLLEQMVTTDRPCRNVKDWCKLIDWALQTKIWIPLSSLRVLNSSSIFSFAHSHHFAIITTFSIMSPSSVFNLFLFSFQKWTIFVFYTVTPITKSDVKSHFCFSIVERALYEQFFLLLLLRNSGHPFWFHCWPDLNKS